MYLNGDAKLLAELAHLRQPLLVVGATPAHEDAQLGRLDLSFLVYHAQGAETKERAPMEH